MHFYCSYLVFSRRAPQLSGTRMRRYLQHNPHSRTAAQHPPDDADEASQHDEDHHSVDKVEDDEVEAVGWDVALVVVALDQAADTAVSLDKACRHTCLFTCVA